MQVGLEMHTAKTHCQSENLPHLSVSARYLHAHRTLWGGWGIQLSGTIQGPLGS